MKFRHSGCWGFCVARSRNFAPLAKQRKVKCHPDWVRLKASHDGAVPVQVGAKLFDLCVEESCRVPASDFAGLVIDNPARALLVNESTVELYPNHRVIDQRRQLQFACCVAMRSQESSVPGDPRARFPARAAPARRPHPFRRRPCRVRAIDCGSRRRPGVCGPHPNGQCLRGQSAGETCAPRFQLCEGAGLPNRRYGTAALAGRQTRLCSANARPAAEQAAAIRAEADGARWEGRGAE